MPILAELGGDLSLGIVRGIRSRIESSVKEKCPRADFTYVRKEVGVECKEARCIIHDEQWSGHYRPSMKFACHDLSFQSRPN